MEKIYAKAAVEEMRGLAAKIFETFKIPDEIKNKIGCNLNDEQPKIKEIIEETLKKTNEFLNDNKKKEAINLLISLQASISTYTIELELIEEVVVPSLNATPELKTLLQNWISHIKRFLGKLASWIFDVIRTMLTPTEWSLEGGVSIPGLADAKITVTFGP